MRLRTQSRFIYSDESGRLEILETKHLSAAEYTNINEMPIDVKELRATWEYNEKVRLILVGNLVCDDRKDIAR